MKQKINELVDVMDDRNLHEACVIEIKGILNDTADLPGHSVSVPESEYGCQNVGMLLSF